VTWRILVAVDNSFTIAVGRIQSWRSLLQPGKTTPFTVCTVSFTLLMIGYMCRWVGASGAVCGMGFSVVHLNVDVIILVLNNNTKT
jgi:hypothetical protein